MKNVLYFSTILFLLTACATNPEKDELAQAKNQAITVKDSHIKIEDREQSLTVSKHLEKLAISTRNVKGATAVALGGYAIVGIDVDQNLDRSEVGTIKYSVAESLKNDPSGANAIVVADPDITARLKEIGQDIQNGHPLQGITNELSDIVGRLMPEVPRLLQDPNPEDAPDKEKKKLNPQTENELNEIQEDQSNQFMKEE
ncbi:YhcN/YlaJ family sporulation lipoprotein [Bacillus spongiae]|uniref:YhcN/YlaJ family sporulation lipoprotein n=1 Tax=Bacillus spongiae TaxID=2683610 RepID=A0ABU8H9N5_9BACI